MTCHMHVPMQGFPIVSYNHALDTKTLNASQSYVLLWLLTPAFQIFSQKIPAPMIIALVLPAHPKAFTSSVKKKFKIS